MTGLLPIFDRCFDDIFSNDRRMSLLFDNSSLISVADIRVRLCLAILTGQTLVATPNFLVDHRSCVRFLADKSWFDFIMSEGLLRIARPFKGDWSKYLTIISGGDPAEPPLEMSSDNNNQVYNEVMRLRDNEKNFEAASQHWRRSFPWVEPLIRKLQQNDQSGIGDFVDEPKRPDYWPYFIGAGQQCADATTIHNFTNEISWQSINGRGAAFRAIDKLYERRVIDKRGSNDLYKAAIEAKFAHTQDWLEAKMVTQPAVKLTSSEETVETEISYSGELPLVSQVMDDKVGLEELKRILDGRVLAIRERYIEKLSEGDPLETTKALEELCYVAAENIGSTAKTARVQLWLAGGAAAFSLAKVTASAMKSEKLVGSRRVFCTLVGVWGVSAAAAVVLVGGGLLGPAKRQVTLNLKNELVKGVSMIS